jgi:hypothetical protein
VGDGRPQTAQGSEPNHKEKLESILKANISLRADMEFTIQELL